MKIKQISKILIAILIILSIIILMKHNVFAFDPNDYNPGTVTYNEGKDLFDLAAPIIKMLTTVGIIISVIAISIVGLKYMLGSAVDQQVKIKESLFPLLFGAFMIGGTSIILKVIIALTNG